MFECSLEKDFTLQKRLIFQQREEICTAWAKINIKVKSYHFSLVVIGDCHTLFFKNLSWSLLNPFTTKILLVILLTVCHSHHVSLENLLLDQQIIKRCNLYFSLSSLLVCLILYWYSKEKFSPGHPWELKS